MGSTVGIGLLSKSQYPTIAVMCAGAAALDCGSALRGFGFSAHAEEGLFVESPRQPCEKYRECGGEDELRVSPG